LHLGNTNVRAFISGVEIRRSILKKKTIFPVLFLLFALCLHGCAGSVQETDTEDSKEAIEEEQMAGEGNSSEASSEYSTAHPATLEVNTPEEEINCWGDSMTEGYGSDGLAYPDVLRQLTGMPVKNLGIGGEDSQEILARSIAYGSQKEDILVIQMGDNGGWRDIDELIRQYQQLLSEAGTDRYIIISSTDDPDDYDQIWAGITDPAGSETTTYEEKYEEAFGEHLFNGRKYLVEHGLEINGLEETDDDRARAEMGDISLQLRNPEIDNTHLNEAGYKAMAYGVYEKGLELGYW